MESESSSDFNEKNRAYDVDGRYERQMRKEHGRSVILVWFTFVFFVYGV